MSAHPLAGLAPSVGFPVTVCVVCYGPHTDLAERFLAGLYRFTDPALFTLRAGLNAVVPETLAVFEEYAGRYGNVELFVEPVNLFKNPLMRKMFHERPVESPWVIWFDDDSHVTRPDWLQRLALKIENEPAVDQWGKIYSLRSGNAALREFIEQAPWFTGVPLRMAADDPGACEFRFATGGFWALRTEVLRALDWPDPRLFQAHDDFLLGEALRQNGRKIGSFHYGVAVNDAPRRNEEAEEVRTLRRD